MSHYGKNDRVIWQEIKAIERWVERNVKPSNKKGPAPKGSRKSKAAHIKGQRTKRQAVQASL